MIACKTCAVDGICFLVNNWYFTFSENAAITIQLHFRGLVARRKFLKMVNAVTLLQTGFRAWLKVKQGSVCMILSTVQVCDSSCGMQFITLSQTFVGFMFHYLSACLAYSIKQKY